MTSKYPASERVSAGKLKVGDELLIRERRSDQPSWSEGAEPFAPGIWTVLDIGASMSTGGPRAQRTYHFTVEHNGAGTRTFHTSPVQRFNRVVGS